MDLLTELGQIDVYVFDLLLRGRIRPGLRVFDAGCGGGRNLVYLMRHGYDLGGNDADSEAIARVRAQAQALAPDAPGDFRVEAIEDTSFPAAHADVVLASAVLHFARDHAHFEAMLRALWRTLRPGGLFFARLASSTGIEGEIDERGGGRYGLPDGSDRYLVDAERLDAWTGRLGAELVDPLKSTVVQGQRSMATWVMRRL